MVGDICQHCRLGNKPVPGYGPPPEEARAVIVGEAPGREEDRKGKPFVGPSGRLLRQVIASTGVDPETIYYTNVVKCRPPGNKLQKRDIECCKRSLQAELKPYADAGVPIGVVGAVPSRVVIGSRYSGSMRGHWVKGGKVFCNWHPAAILHAPAVFWDFYFGMHKMMRGQQEPLRPEIEVFDVLNDRTLDALYLWLEQLPDDWCLCYDLETESASPYWAYDVLSMAIADAPHHAIVVTEEVLYSEPGQEWLRAFFDRDFQLVGHNVKFDLRYLRAVLDIQNAHATYDSMLAHYVLYEEASHALKDIASLMLDAPPYDDVIDEYINKNKDNWRGVPPSLLYEYNALDVCYNLLLWCELKEQLKEDGLFDKPFMYPIMASQPALLRCELTGMYVEEARILEAEQQMKDYAHELHMELQRMCGREFNPRSYIQVGDIMYDYYGAPEVRGKWTERSTCDQAKQKILQQIDPESELATWLKMHAQYRSVEKIRSSYVQSLLDTMDPENRVHCDMKVHGARTGRMSVSDPPLHSIPKPGHNRPGTPDWGKVIRSVFTVPSDEWVFVMSDYSQAELRVVACMSEDPFMLEAYRQGKDLHGEAARMVYGEDYTPRHRQICKSVNFSQVYGGSPESAAVEADMDPAAVRHLSAQYHKNMARLYEWRWEQFMTLKKQGYVATCTGRRRRAPVLTRFNKRDMEKMAVNTPVQGSASELTLISLMEYAEWVDEHEMQDVVKLLLTVHDSVIVQIHRSVREEAIEALQSIMMAVGERYFPAVPWVVDVEVGPSWGELHESK